MLANTTVTKTITANLGWYLACQSSLEVLPATHRPHWLRLPLHHRLLIGCLSPTMASWTWESQATRVARETSHLFHRGLHHLLHQEHRLLRRRLPTFLSQRFSANVSQPAWRTVTTTTTDICHTEKEIGRGLEGYRLAGVAKVVRLKLGRPSNSIVTS